MIELIGEIAKRLRDSYGAQEIILFGSYLRGDNTEDSDIDLLIVSETRERFFDRQATVRRLIRNLKKGIPVSPIVLTPDEIEDRSRRGDHFINEILASGLRI